MGNIARIPVVITPRLKETFKERLTQCIVEVPKGAPHNSDFTNVSVSEALRLSMYHILEMTDDQLRAFIKLGWTLELKDRLKHAQADFDALPEQDKAVAAAFGQVMAQ